MANRRTFIAGLLGFLALPTIGRPKERISKFVVTFPRDIKANEPIEVEAQDRIWALASLGATVWTEEEWKAAKIALSEEKNNLVCY